jgi:flagellar biogenesis protein FliO
MKNLILITLLAMIVSLDASSAITLKKVDFQKNKNNGQVIINYKGSLDEYPELKITKSTIQVYFPDSKVSKTFDRKVSFSTNVNDTRLQAEQISSNVSKIKLTFPFNVKKHEENITLTLKNNKIVLLFPKIKVKDSVVYKKTKKAKKSNLSSKKFDEAYLNNLLAVKGKEVDKKVNKIKKKSFFKDERRKTDVVKTTLAAIKKTPKSSKSNFSFAGYAGKFIAFLVLVLGLFYGVVHLLKKGVTSKGKLGFLNSSNLVEVLSTTYVSPKKSLLMIKAHNQVFLVSNSESGMQMISEVNDVPGLVKEGEKSITGTNFDTDFDLADMNGLNSKVKIKENIMMSDNTKENVKFSDQIKKKVKKMKDLQL